MAFISQKDLTLEAMRSAVAASRATHGALNMGAIGDCDRAAWLKFRNVFATTGENIEPLADAGEAVEKITVEHLKRVSGVEIVDRDPNDSTSPITFSDIEGHFKSRASGVILGIASAPKTWHILDCMAVGNTNFDRFQRIKGVIGEKAALQKWSPSIYSRAQLAMHYSGLTRHYFVASSSGGSLYDSCRTDYDAAFSLRHIERARRIITDNEPPARIDENPAFETCRECPVFMICHFKMLANRDCRNCIHAQPIENGKWFCDRWHKTLENFEPCPAHKFVPGVVGGEPIAADDHSITYKMKSGKTFKDGEQ